MSTEPRRCSTRRSNTPGDRTRLTDLREALEDIQPLDEILDTRDPDQKSGTAE